VGAKMIEIFVCSKCGFTCHSKGLYESHKERCELGLSESEHIKLVRRRKAETKVTEDAN
jgi:hypothetical protein